MSVAIRTAVRADIPAMHRLRLAVGENRLSRPDSIAAQSYVPFVESRNAWVAEDYDAIVGFAALDAEAGSVWALFVSADAQGMGIGKRLHDTLVIAAVARGIARLRLSTEAGTRAETFYYRKGWVGEGVNPKGEVDMNLALPQAAK